MKKIIKKPYYQVRCPKCGCHFTFDLEDLYNHYGEIQVINCPCCENKIATHDNSSNLLYTVKVHYKKENTNESK